MKHNRISLILLVFFSSILLGISHEKSVDLSDNLDTTLKEKIIQEIAEKIEANYVFPDKGREIAEYIKKRLKEKAYNRIATLKEFIQVLTKDLRTVNDDAHLGIVPRRGGFKTGGTQEDMYKSFLIKRAPFHNYGFKKAERLLGNIGCLVVDEFSYIEVDGKNVGGETARAVMQVLSTSYALIIDLRDNFGGREEMALLLLNYFFQEPTHILTNRYRGREEKQIWTQVEKGSGRLAQIPLYVLTSRHTVSGGEMFAFVLKNRKRATLLGEKTRGAAHKTHIFSLKSSKIDMAIPVGTTIDPVTGTDWERQGVEPDIVVSAGKAMDMAYKMALEKVMQSGVDRTELSEMKWALMEVDATLNPVFLDKVSLQEYVGVFGERKFYIENGKLFYKRVEQSAYELAPMSKDLFSFVDKGMFYVRIRFNRDDSGTINKIIMLYDTGQKREYTKTQFPI